MMPKTTTIACLLAAGAMAVGLSPDFGLASEPAHVHMRHGFTAGEPGDPKEASRVVTIELREGVGQMSYAPDKVVVSAGDQIRFVLKNVGDLDHEFLLDSVANNAEHKGAMQKNPEMEHADPNGARIKPKTTAEILWRFTKKGTFEFACLIPGHYEAGMRGVVEVR